MQLRIHMFMASGVSFRQFARDLKNEIAEDNVSNGAAALAFYLTLSIFPAMIVLLTVIPFLPIANVDQAIMELLREALPGQAATMFTGVVQEITQNQKGGLLSVGLLFTLWTASNGMYAIMQQLNITYDVKEGRSFVKSRAIALLLTLLFGVLIVGAFAAVVMGGKIQGWLAESLGWGPVLMALFAAMRYVIVAVAALLGFALVYYLGPDVEQRFKFITPGSVLGVALLGVASFAFKFYVDNFGKYDATYGSIGAVIVLMLWLYVTGLVLLLGSEINALVEHYNPRGKEKGEKVEGQHERHIA